MRITRFNAGESVEELVARVYKGLKTKKAARDAAASLRAVNPRLRDVADLEDGVRIVVPDLSGTAPAGRTTPAGRAGADALVRGLRIEAFLVTDELVAAAEEMAEESALRTKSLDTLDLALVKDLPEIKDAVAEIEDEAKRDLKTVDVLTAHGHKLREALGEDAVLLAKRLG